MFKGLFHKKGEVLDLSNLYKKGILKIQKNKPEEVIELSNNTEDHSGLGFLGTFAQSAETSEKQANPSISPEAKEKIKNLLKEIRGKLDTSSQQVYRLINRIDLLEKKVERLERRTIED